MNCEYDRRRRTHHRHLHCLNVIARMRLFLFPALDIRPRTAFRFLL